MLFCFHLFGRDDTFNHAFFVNDESCMRALRVIRNRQEELSDEVKTEYLGLILDTVTGVSAGLQNTG